MKKKPRKSLSKKHGDKYDYSLVDYDGALTNVNIICETHGVFPQTPHSHLSRQGQGCPKCGNIKRAMAQKSTTEEFIEKARAKYGDKYEYSLVDYVNNRTNVNIICETHGVFPLTPHSHLSRQGQGCPKCGNIKRAMALKRTTEEFIEEARAKHGDKYDYSLVDYVNNRTNVKIKCPIHGLFTQTPNRHLIGSRCQKCAGNQKKDTKEFIKQAQNMHGDKYDYSDVVYTNAKTPVNIKCKLNGHGVFPQIPYSHISGQGCPKCGRIKNTESLRKTTKEFIKQAQNMHGDKYDYSDVVYTNAKIPIRIKCPNHGLFEQRPDHHLFGSGCPTCNHGWSRAKILEFIDSIDNHDLLYMDAIELQTIINQGKLPDALNFLVFSDPVNRENTLKALKESLKDQWELEDEDFTEDIEEEPLTEAELYEDDVEESDIKPTKVSGTDNRTKISEPLSLSNKFEDLHALDHPIVASCDEEAVRFLIQYRLSKLWNDVLNDLRDIDKLKQQQGGKNFTLLKNLFFNEYEEVKKYQPPEGYSFKYAMNRMQQLTVYRMLKNRRYGNWSGTGAGKTLSFIVSSRAVYARLTVVIGLNSTISELADAIKDVYPDSNVFTHYRKGQVFDRADRNYLILNYDKFQQKYSEGLFQNLTENNRIDFIAIDEVHNVKQRTEQESIRRGTLKRLIGRARENNPDLYVLGMSATPVINNLSEAKSLLEMITGKEYEDLNTNRSLTNALEVFKQMTLNGLRYKPKYDILIKELDGTNTPELRIDGTHLLEKLLRIRNHNYLKAEQLLLIDKLKSIGPYLKKGMIIYSYFIQGMIKPICDYLTSLGFKVGTYTGNESTKLREQNKRDFINGKIDILVGSKPIGTGVDGLQAVCNKLIVLSLPWTDSEYTQLKGRIYRQGSNFGEVEIIVPQVVIPLADREWSWDMQRMNLIRNKKTLADAAVDGVIPSKKLPSPKTLFAKSLEALKEWKERLNEGQLFRIDRKDLVFPLHPEIVDQISKQIGDFSEMNRKWSVSKSSTTHERLKEHPEDWYYYHTLYSEKRKTWEEVPYVEIAKAIKREDFLVADLGCGENLLRKEIPKNKVLSFDHVAIDKSVVACDISNIPIDDNKVDVVVLSLSLMGTNYKDYIKEAHRILKHMGFIFIAEPQNKWEGKQNELEKLIVNAGFNKPEINVSSNFLYLKSYKS